VHLTVAVMDFPTLARNGFLYDDSFYAFQIARNIATGHGATFDGVEATNGFQPLYVALLVPLFAVAGGSETIPIHLALIVSALLTVGTAYLLYRLLLRHAGDTAACIAAAAWSFSPIVMRQSANGLETALALFMLASTVVYYLENVRGETRPGRRRFAMLGVLAGLAILARLDLSILILCMSLDYLLVLRRRGERVPIGVLTTAGVAALVILPWALYGWFAVGSPFPESGRATRFLSLSYAPFHNLGESSMGHDGPTASFIGALFVRSVETLRVIPVLHPFFRGTRKLEDHVSPVILDTVAHTVAVALMIGFVVWWYHRRRRDVARTAGEFDFLILFGVTTIAAYSAWVFGVFFFLRYYYPIYFVSMIFAGLVIDDVINAMRARAPRMRRVALVACGVYASALMYMGYTSAFRTTPVYRFYDAAFWVRTHTDTADVIGAFQSGTIGYLSQRKVVDLDGKVNREAFRALQDHSVNEYLRAAGVDVVMDHMPVLNLFLGPWTDKERKRIEGERVFTGGEHGLPGWIGYRVTPPRPFSAGASLGPSPSSHRKP